MAIALDQSLGFINPTSNGTSFSFTTGAAAAANTRIIVQVSLWDNATTPTIAVTIGGVAMTMDAGPLLNPNQRSWFFSLYTATGIASGTTIAGTLVTLCDAIQVNASSWTGLQSTSGYVETSGSGTLTDSSHWLTPTVSVASPSALLFAFSTCDTLPGGSSTPTAPAIELFDYSNVTVTQTTTAAYRIVTPGSYNIGGTWSGSNAQQLSGIIAYKAEPSPLVPIATIQVPMRKVSRYAK